MSLFAHAYCALLIAFIPHNYKNEKKFLNEQRNRDDAAKKELYN